MKKFSDMLSGLSTSDLISLFADIGVSQSDAIEDEDNRKFNGLFRKQMAIISELKMRPGDHRIQLMDLYTHPNLQVQLNAARATRVFAPEEVRAKLEAIAASRRLPQSGDAGMALYAWDNGIWKPD